MESMDPMQIHHGSALQPSREYGKVGANVEGNLWTMQQNSKQSFPNNTNAGMNPFQQFNEMAQKRQHGRHEVGTGEAGTPIPEYISFLSVETNTNGASDSPESLSSVPEGNSYVPTDDTSTMASESTRSIAPDVVQQGSSGKIQPKLNINVFHDDLNQKNACGDGPQQSHQLHFVQGGTSPFEGLDVMGQAQSLNDPANSGDDRFALPIQQHHQQERGTFLSPKLPTQNDVGLGGPPMGSSVRLTPGQTVANYKTTSLSANNHNAALRGMDTLSLQPQQYQPLQQPFAPNETGTGNMSTNQKKEHQQQHQKQQSRQHYSGPSTDCVQQEQQKASDTHYLRPSNGLSHQQPQEQEYLSFHQQQGMDKSAVNQAYCRNKPSAIPTSWEQMNFACQSQGNLPRWEEMNQTKSIQTNWNPPEQHQHQQPSSDAYGHYGSTGFPQTTYGGQDYSRRSEAIPDWNDGENSPAPHAYIPTKHDITPDTYKERQMWSYENSSAYEQYDQYSSDDPDTRTHNAIRVYKSSMDVTRERSAGMMALRLIDEAADNYKSTEVRSPNLSMGLSAGFAAQQTAQQAAQKSYDEKQEEKRQMKMIYREHQRMISQPEPSLLAESSRKTINFRRGYDPDLETDKCKLDFEREKFAKKKALQLMSYTREFYSR